MDRQKLTLDEYQAGTRGTASYPDLEGHSFNPVYPALGLVGEAGEVAEKIKKIWRNQGLVFSPSDRVALMNEMGDVLWYLAALSHELGIPLSTVAQENLNKLADRKARGVIKSEGDNR